jgi:hypothetical protein
MRVRTIDLLGQVGERKNAISCPGLILFGNCGELVGHGPLAIS